MVEDDVARLKRAYEVLGIPLSASALAIKQAYRRMAKRWHPDLYRTGTPAHDEAAQMMKLINEEYSLVEHAPLRYYIETYPTAARKKNHPAYCGGKEQREVNGDTLRVTDRLEFWVRFACGAFMGVFVGWRLFFSLFDQPTVLLVVVGSLVLGCAFGAAKFGDRFWRSILGRWWLWG